MLMVMWARRADRIAATPSRIPGEAEMAERMTESTGLMLGG